jgi:hypothetical protein
MGCSKRRIAGEVNSPRHEAIVIPGVKTPAAGYIPSMKIFLMILLGLDMLAVVAVMLVGSIGMANLSRDPRTSNLLMRLRVGLQGVAIGLVVLLMLTG